MRFIGPRRAFADPVTRHAAGPSKRGPGGGRGGGAMTILYLVGFGLIALSVLASRDRVPC
jgi:hypothetical protein